MKHYQSPTFVLHLSHHGSLSNYMLPDALLWYTVSAPQMCCIKYSTTVSKKKSYLNIICAPVEITD